MADGQDQFTGVEMFRIAHRGGGKLARIDSEQGEVQLLVAPDKDCREGTPVSQDDLDVAASRREPSPRREHW